MMAHRSTHKFLAVVSVLLAPLGTACGDNGTAVGSTGSVAGASSPVGPTSGMGPARGGPEFVPAPSFDACYPWKKGEPREPPTFQLNAARAPASNVFIMPGSVVFAGSQDGWEAGFDEAKFAALWELGKLARVEQPKGQDLSGGDPVRFTLAIGCGDFYSWFVHVSRAFAMSGDGATADLARQLFALIDNPPADAVR